MADFDLQLKDERPVEAAGVPSPSLPKLSLSASSKQHIARVHCGFPRNYFGQKLNFFNPQINNVSVLTVPPASNVEPFTNQRELDTSGIPAVPNQRELHTFMRTLIGLLQLITSWIMYIQVHRPLTVQSITYMSFILNAFVKQSLLLGVDVHSSFGVTGIFKYYYLLMMSGGWEVLVYF